MFSLQQNQTRGLNRFSGWVLGVWMLQTKYTHVSKKDKIKEKKAGKKVE
jgi:hypothetical protein